MSCFRRSLLGLAALAVCGIHPAIAEEPPVTREAVCRWTKTAPKLDGKLDDPAWADAAVIDRFPAFWKGVDNGKGTRVKLLWDNEGLYFAGEMTDQEMRSFGTKHNDSLWNGDVFEMFFKPDSDKPAYYEFQSNPKGVMFEVAFPERGAKVGDFSALPGLGMTVVAVVDGTLDKPGDKDKGWTVEGRIPWTAFASTGGRPKLGDAWKFAICRYDYGPEGTAPTLFSSAPLTQPSFHRHEDYGKLKFEEPKP